jgi:tRNA A-37 threonylcarbamoyl transferase component Bud32/membrane-associated phospholipid phosphatase
VEQSASGAGDHSRDLTVGSAHPAAASPWGRRRPSGEPQPLPRPVSRSTRLLGLAAAGVVVLWLGLAVGPTARAITSIDLAALELLEAARVGALTSIAEVLEELASPGLARVIAWVTLLALLALRRFQHLLTYLLLVLVVTAANTTVGVELGRMRPAGIEIIGSWSGYAHPSASVAGLAFVLVGVLYTLVPSGTWRRRGAWVSGLVVGALVASRLYLGVDHPTDVAAALATGAALPVVAFRLIVPDEVFPLTYRGGRRAHLDVGGRRGAAIVAAVRSQLDLDVRSVEPFALAGSAGSTPLRITVRADGGAPRLVFAKLYALQHLRSDRWYKLGRTVLYGRLEDELPFNAVRRLVGYEDHMLRLLRDAGVPTARPYGIVEITPEREYLVVTEFLEGAVELTGADVDDVVIDRALAAVRRLWDAGLAHRDIKPSNVLVRDGEVFLIDVAFAETRPTPWRQAVDLANMMLTLALCTTPERVYDGALRHFTPDDVAEAFAASRGVTIPSQLRARLQADGRDLRASFCELAPAREPVRIQRWGVRRAGITAGLAAAVVGAGALVAVNLRLAGLL